MPIPEHSKVQIIICVRQEGTFRRKKEREKVLKLCPFWSTLNLLDKECWMASSLGYFISSMQMLIQDEFRMNVRRRQGNASAAASSVPTLLAFSDCMKRTYACMSAFKLL